MGSPFQYKPIKVILAQVYTRLEKCNHLYQNNQNQIQFPPYSPGKLKAIPLGDSLFKCENIIMV